MKFKLCSPALLYLVFSVTQVVIDAVKGLYNVALVKFIMMILFTLLLNIFCERGLGIISWIIVFIPFILMTVIVSMLLYVFGLDAATGKLNYGKCDDKDKKHCNKDVTTDSLGNIVVYDPEYNPSLKPVYYQSPNIIVPNPHLNDSITTTKTTSYSIFPSGSSSPAYQS